MPLNISLNIKLFIRLICNLNSDTCRSTGIKNVKIIHYLNVMVDENIKWHNQISYDVIIQA